MATGDGGTARGLSPGEVVGRLGNDTRVGILQTCWDIVESGVGDNALSFSEPFDRVDSYDSGPFSYHLEKLTGPRPPGRRGVRTPADRQQRRPGGCRRGGRRRRPATRDAGPATRPRRGRAGHRRRARPRERGLARFDLESTDFPPMRTRPVLVDTATLAALGWEARAHAGAIERTVMAHLDGDRPGGHHGPPRETERRAIDALTTRP